MENKEDNKIRIIYAKEAYNRMPQHQPISREIYRRIVGYTFHIIEKRSEVGYNYVDMPLSEFPALEKKRTRLLKRLGYNVRETEFSLHISWG
jgi:hypothetical protein